MEFDEWFISYYGKAPIPGDKYAEYADRIGKLKEEMAELDAWLNRQREYDNTKHMAKVIWSLLISGEK